MKKLIFCLAIAAIGALSATAQDGERIFKKFKGDVSLGYALPVGSGANGGVLFALEPKFALMDKLSVGLRIEGAVMGRFSGYNTNGVAQVENARAVESYVATADYYFTNNYSFRPFVGGGGGIFALATDVTMYNNNQVTVTKFGGIIRAGAEVKHFRFGVEYNIVPSSDIASFTYDNQGMPLITQSKSKNGYIGIKVGFCFGGGPL